MEAKAIEVCEGGHGAVSETLRLGREDMEHTKAAGARRGLKHLAKDRRAILQDRPREACDLYGSAV